MALITRRKIKVILLLGSLALASAGFGFFCGIFLAKVIEKKKEDPVFWKEAALKHLEKLKPDDAQRKQFEIHTDSAVKELRAIHGKAIEEVWDVIERTIAKIEPELSSEQRSLLDQIKPKRPAPLSTETSVPTEPQP